MEKWVGQVTHYYTHLGVAVLDLNDNLKVGDHIHIVHNYRRDFSQEVQSMEVNHRKVPEVGPHANVAIEVDEPVRQGDDVYKEMENLESLGW